MKLSSEIRVDRKGYIGFWRMMRGLGMKSRRMSRKYVKNLDNDVAVVREYVVYMDGGKKIRVVVTHLQKDDLYVVSVKNGLS